jgi:hypothetical protein
LPLRRPRLLLRPAALLWSAAALSSTVIRPGAPGTWSTRSARAAGSGRRTARIAGMACPTRRLALAPLATFPCIAISRLAGAHSTGVAFMTTTAPAPASGPGLALRMVAGLRRGRRFLARRRRLRRSLLRRRVAGRRGI